MKRWVVINIGCIECGVDSDVVGVFSCDRKADEICESLNRNKEANWMDGGENYYKVFLLGDIDKVSDRYIKFFN